MKRPFHASLLPLQPAFGGGVAETCFAFGNGKSTHSGSRGEQRAQGGALALRQPRRPHIQQQQHPLPGPLVRNLVLEAVVEHRALALPAPQLVSRAIMS